MSRGELSTATLVRYLQGEMTRSEIEETERLIADSRRAQERLAELRAMTGELRRPAEWAESVDLVEELRGRLAAGEPAARAERAVGKRRRWMLGGGAALAAAAAAVALVTLDASPGERRSEPGGAFRSKGAGDPASSDPGGDPDRWVGIRPALVRGSGPPEPIEAGGRLSAGAIQIAYTNLGPRPYDHLMVFAVDAGGQVRWLYPAYERAGTDPAAIRIEAGAADLLLPDLVEHDFARGRLALCGLFLRQPLTVGQVEAALGGKRSARRLPFAGSGQHCLDLEAE